MLPQVLAVLAIGIAAAALVVAVAMVRALRRQLEAREGAMNTMQNDLRALCNAAVTVGERMNQLESQVAQLDQRQRELGLRQEQLGQAEPEERSYDQAVKLVQRGAGVEELMEICGLTRGEAELVAMMHRMDVERY